MIKNIYIENNKQHEALKNFTALFKEEQNNLETYDTFIYTAIPINVAFKYKILYPDFMLHPEVIKKRKFYEDIKVITKRKDITDLISKVLQIEMINNSDNLLISEKTIKCLIKEHKKLSINNKKNVIN